MARPSEDELIARYFAPLAGPGGLGLQDDAALISPPPGQDLVVTVDALVSGVHFLAHDPPDTIGVKALAVNLSDLAAKGAEPVGFLLALALPDDWGERWLAAFAEGLGALSRSAGCPLLGGDTVRAAGPLTLSVTAIGRVPEGRMVRRTTARAGDLLCVSGTIGDAVLGLRLGCPDPPPSLRGLDAADAGFLLDRYRRPQPRLALAGPLLDLAGAAMDVSDGLAGDAAKMLRSSGVTATLDLESVPFSPAAGAAVAACRDWRDRLVTGGDDYEILFSLAPERWPEMRRRAEAAGVAVTAIGQVRPGDGPPAFRDVGVPYALAPTSFRHF